MYNFYGRGYSVDNLKNIRKFYMTYSKSETLSRISLENISEISFRKSEKGIKQTVSAIFSLSWLHYLSINALVGVITNKEF